MVKHRSLSDVTLGNAQPSNSAQTSNECLDTTTFTVEQECNYARRYEEGYDLPDKYYEAWLKINHPGSPKVGSTQQMPSLSGNMSLSGSADNSASLSKSPPPASMISNRDSVAAQCSPLSELLNIPIANNQKRKLLRGKHVY